MHHPISYTCSRLNSTTYLIVHKDKFIEYPFIYLKVYRKIRLAVVIDTGCGPQNCADANVDVPDLKDFIDNFLLQNDLHSADYAREEEIRSYKYAVICTHCHYDHIGGIESFANAGAIIVASSHDEAFLSRENLPTNSQCAKVGMPTPQYSISIFARDGKHLRYRGESLGLRVLHTPGHTPDSLAVYDEAERWLYVGDTGYKRVYNQAWGERTDEPIVFPPQGDWRDYAASLQKLMAFVDAQENTADVLAAAKKADTDAVKRWRVRIACGHTTSDAPARELLASMYNFFCRVVAGMVPVISRSPGNVAATGRPLAEEMLAFWREEGDPEFSLLAPERLKDDFLR